MKKLVTVAIGGPDNPVLAQGEFVAVENGLTLVRICENVIVRGRQVTADSQKSEGTPNG
jgi:hypothetical protein